MFPIEIMKPLQQLYLKKIKERWGESIFRNTIRTKDFSLTDEPAPGKTHEAIAK